MELIATARFKKALDRATEAEAYTRKIAELAADLSASAGDVTHPLLEKRETIKNSLLLVISSNRGLCGGYNAGILREATSASAQIQAEGVDAAPGAVRQAGHHLLPLPGHPGRARPTRSSRTSRRFDEVEELANRYIADYIAGTDRPRRGGLHEVPQRRPADAGGGDAAAAVAVGAGSDSKPQTPTAAGRVRVPARAPRTSWKRSLPVSFKVRLFKCFLDAAVSEQIARRVAMKAATENAGDMIKTLTRQYNRARQAQITKEIAEVIGGAEALK